MEPPKFIMDRSDTRFADVLINGSRRHCVGLYRLQKGVVKGVSSKFM